ncbi:hypothetical protein DL93DRAFT_2084144 [Clavulina sp. PMI_390]|nr:hypothetical protein DL93DRAFT_2084144 [Clavulina sp. PMI_390]
MAPPKFEHVEVDLTRVLYSYLFGILVASILSGVITVQIHLYYKRFPRDSLSTHCVVCEPAPLIKHRSNNFVVTVLSGLLSQVGLLWCPCSVPSKQAPPQLLLTNNVSSVG